MLPARFIQGLSGGLYLAVLPQFTSEITPKMENGKYGAINKVFLPIGVSSCFAFGTLLPSQKEQSAESLFIIFWPAGLVLFQALVNLTVFSQDTPYEMLLAQQNEARILSELTRIYSPDSAL